MNEEEQSGICAGTSCSHLETYIAFIDLPKLYGSNQNDKLLEIL